MYRHELVSVVIPAFNREAVIGEALRSLQRQTHANWHAYVVDDASTDRTCAVVQDMCRHDARITLLKHSVRKGAQAARNTGIRAACSRWIAFLDSDDLYLPGSLEQRLRCAMENNVEVVHSTCGFIDRAGNPTDTRFVVRPLAGNVYADVLRGPGPVFPALLVTKEALVAIGLLDESITSFQEWDTAIRLAEKYSFGFVEAPTFLYRLDGTDSISRSALRSARGYVQIVRKHWERMLRIAGYRGLAKHCARVARIYWHAVSP